jgi:hypothetical protein
MICLDVNSTKALFIVGHEPSLIRSLLHRYMASSSMREGTMDGQEKPRRVPVVCVTDGKQHNRRFLRGALSEFGFT